MKKTYRFFRSHGRKIKIQNKEIDLEDLYIHIDPSAPLKNKKVCKQIVLDLAKKQNIELDPDLITEDIIPLILDNYKHDEELSEEYFDSPRHDPGNCPIIKID